FELDENAGRYLGSLKGPERRKHNRVRIRRFSRQIESRIACYVSAEIHTKIERVGEVTLESDSVIERKLCSRVEARQIPLQRIIGNLLRFGVWCPGSSAQSRTEKRPRVGAFLFFEVVHDFHAEVIDASVKSHLGRRRGLSNKGSFVRLDAEERFFTPMACGVDVEAKTASDCVIEMELLLDRNDCLRKRHLVIRLGTRGSEDKRIQFHIAKFLSKDAGRNSH